MTERSSFGVGGARRAAKGGGVRQCGPCQDQRPAELVFLRQQVEGAHATAREDAMAPFGEELAME